MAYASVYVGWLLLSVLGCVACWLADRVPAQRSRPAPRTTRPGMPAQRRPIA